MPSSLPSRTQVRHLSRDSRPDDREALLQQSAHRTSPPRPLLHLRLLAVAALLLGLSALFALGSCGSDESGASIEETTESIGVDSERSALATEPGLNTSVPSSMEETPTPSASDPSSGDEEELYFCEDEDECPPGLAFCVPLDDAGEVGVCVRSCVNVSDCPDGFTCGRFSTDRDAPSICLPETFCLDEDGDRYGVGPGCLGPDCDDTNPDVNPGAVERCDGMDTNCNGRVDDFPIYGTWEGEEVRMGDPCDTGEPGRCAAGTWQCLNGDTRCVATDTPRSEETCNGIDDTCDGLVDATEAGPLERLSWSGEEGQQDIGECRPQIERCEEGSWVRVRDERLPAEEVCDELDRSCSGDPFDVPAERLQSDPENCGVCGVRCDPPLTCVAGSCRCEGNLLACGEECVDETSDARHCGTCDRACGPGKSCVEGTCRCPGGGLFCDGACIDPLTNVRHCGTCDNACASAELCIGGNCRCPSSTDTFCDPACVNLQQDRNNCGACGTTCLDDQSCVNGACRCPGGQTLCGGRCVDTTQSNLHCGACDNACTGDLLCQNSNCRCPGTLRPCGDQCVPEPIGDTCYTLGGTPGEGPCQAGTWTCTASNTATCSGQIGPQTRVCDGTDNNCNGVVDDGCPTGVTVNASTVGPVFGGSGGDAFSRECAPGQVVVGFLVRHGSRIDRLQVRCATPTLQTSTLSIPYTYTLTTGTGFTSLATVGGTGGSQSTYRCPNGTAVYRVSGRSGSNVDAFRIHCAGWAYSGTPGSFQITRGPTSVSPQYGGSGGSPFDYTCPGNGALTGLVGRSGARVDRIQPLCSTLSPTLR